MKTLSDESRKKLDFYLASTESDNLQTVRECWLIKHVKTRYQNEGMLITVNPPITGEPYGLGSQLIDTVMIAPRHQGRTLFPVSQWPLAVYVVRLLVDPLTIEDMVHEGEYELIDWAELYKTREEAIRVISVLLGGREEFLKKCNVPK